MIEGSAKAGRLVPAHVLSVPESDLPAPGYRQRA